MVKIQIKCLESSFKVSCLQTAAFRKIARVLRQNTLTKIWNRHLTSWFLFLLKNSHIGGSCTSLLKKKCFVWIVSRGKIVINVKSSHDYSLSRWVVRGMKYQTQWIALKFSCRDTLISVVGSTGMQPEFIVAVPPFMFEVIYICI